MHFGKVTGLRRYETSVTGIGLGIISALILLKRSFLALNTLI